MEINTKTEVFTSVKELEDLFREKLIISKELGLEEIQTMPDKKGFKLIFSNSIKIESSGLLGRDKFLDLPIEDQDLSVRAFNCLKANKVKNFRELLEMNALELFKFRNFGKKSYDEINKLFVPFGLSLPELP